MSALPWVALGCDRSAPQLLHDLLAVLKTVDARFGAIAVDEFVTEPQTRNIPAREYEAGAAGARGSILSPTHEVPALSYVRGGKVRTVKFDGIRGRTLIDRKRAILTTPNKVDQALRQSEALSQNGLCVAAGKSPTNGKHAEQDACFTASTSPTSPYG